MKIFSHILLVFSSFLLAVPNTFGISLWNSAQPKYFYVDRTARNVGDLLTILVSEASEANRDSTTEVDKQTSLVGSITSFLFPLSASKAMTHNGSLPAWQWDNEHQFSGGGKMENKEDFTAKLTVRIIDVLPNGNMIFEGNKSIEYINETINLVITGMVGQLHISSDNTVLSEYCSDFQVKYSGKGPVTQAQRKGLMVRLWDFANIL